MVNIEQNLLTFKKTLYGELSGNPVYLIELNNGDVTVSITNIGCAITSIYTPDKNGRQQNIVAGFKDLKDYKENEFYLGCTLGRYANRIANGRFNLNEKEFKLSVNEGINHLHGGTKGFNKQVWNIGEIIRNENEVGVEFNYLSEDGEEGYPGNAFVKIKYVLNNNNQLIVDYCAETDKPTPINLSNHSYFNLTGFEETILNHELQINAFNYTEKNSNNIPTGNILPLNGTLLDFIKPKKIGDNINKMLNDKGFDYNYILKKHLLNEMFLAAQLHEPNSGRILNIYSDQPAIQLYTANFWDGSITGQQEKPYIKHGAVALETQSFPDSPNQPAFPNTILNPGEHYLSTTIYEFKIKQ